MKIVAATANMNKIDEIREKFSGIGHVEIIPVSDLGPVPEITEDADSFKGNALIKAKIICRMSGMASMADDSGLVVDALNGEPGVYSARYGGPGLDDRARYMLILHRMEDIPDEARQARFVCAIAIVLPDGREFVTEGSCEGLITRSPEGNTGFGYDPVFFIPEKRRTMAQLSMKEKNSLSHRGRALDKAAIILKDLAAE
ncbi:MAG TPA: XTP/dITP diphosphatase [Spirochaetota bacterium]|nr:XTP/dITP diphosphatase [Spirochaetota bacterium]